MWSKAPPEGGCGLVDEGNGTNTYDPKTNTYTAAAGQKTAGLQEWPWSPGTDGLRNITGTVKSDGTATIYAVTSTVSGNGDQGADPNKIVVITDQISATTLPMSETFSVFKSAGNLEVLRGISFTPSR